MTCFKLIYCCTANVQSDQIHRLSLLIKAAVIRYSRHVTMQGNNRQKIMDDRK